ELVAQRIGGGLGFRRLGRGEEVGRISARDGGLFQELEIFARPGDDRLRHAGERGDLQAVALARRAVLYCVKEDDAVLVLHRVEMDVRDLLVFERKARHLEVVRGKEAERAVALDEMARDRPGEREAVE